jgi:hypothetical protein
VRAPGIGWLILEAAEPVQWETLGEADARADGFATLAEMDRAIRLIYPDLQEDGKSWFRLRFHLEPAEEMGQLAAAVRAELDKAVRDSRS